MKKITVIVSDDHAVFREGLRLLLDAAGDIEVIAEAENGSRAVGETKRLQPDVVLMDIAMPRMNGVEAARRITREVPHTKVLMLSTYSHAHYVQRAVEAGAAGFLRKETAARDLLKAIRGACKGNAFFSPPVARGLLKRRRNPDLQSNPMAAGALSSRQTEVLKLLAEGYSNKQIAGLLSVSPKTVEKHRQAVMFKLDIHELASLTRYAVSSGVVESGHTPLAVHAHGQSSRWRRPTRSPRSETQERKPKVNAKHAEIMEMARACEAETLLVVDDDVALRQMEVEMLRQLGYTVLEAEGPAEAMQLAAATPTIDLLLADFGMPEGNGLELTRQFREVHPETPVLMIASSLETIYGRAEYPDRFAVLAKPFTYEELVDGVVDMLSAPTTRQAVASL